MEIIKNWIIKNNVYIIIGYIQAIQNIKWKDMFRFFGIYNLQSFINNLSQHYNIAKIKYNNIFEGRFLSNALKKLVKILSLAFFKECQMKNKCFTEKNNLLLVFRKNLVLSVFSFFLFFQGYSQCSTLELTTNNAALCQPALFKWVVKNAPAGSSYFWDFGNGSQQGQDTFYVFLSSPGKISVSVQIQFPNGKVCTIRKKNFVEIFPKPVPAYTSSRQLLCDGTDTVTYNDITPNSIKRSWVIDGTNYYNAPIKQVHNYSSAGFKRLSLIVEDTNGCKAIKEFDTACIIYKDVILDFNADNRSGCVAKSVKFNPTINNNGHKLVSYKWTFPGGLPFQQFKLNPDTIKYNAAGSFSPSLEVITDKGCVHNYTKDNFLSFGFIDAITLKLSDTSVCVGKTIVVENIDKSLPGKFTWKLPGTTTINNPDQYTCQARYDTLGKYNISVSYDYNGCTVTKQLTDAIRVKGVQAQFISYDYYHCLLPHMVHFKNLSKSSDPGNMIYQWSIFYDSKLVKSSTNINDSFNVKQIGDYDVRLVTRHANGCRDTIIEKRAIRSQKIMPYFGADFQVGCVNQPMQFYEKTEPSSYKAPDQFRWTFYDKGGVKILGYATGNDPKFAYKDTGFYTVKMIADNGIGCIDSMIRVNYIEIVNTKIDFELADSIICKNETLIGKAKSEPKRAKFNFFWYLQNKIDGSQINIQDSILNTSVSKAGEYTFKFAHEINKGCRDTIEKNYFIKINGINAELKLDTFDGCTPLSVHPTANITENYHFENSSNRVKYKWTSYPSNNVTISNDTIFNPEFIFNTRGEFYITLEIENSTGCRQTVYSQPIYVGVIAGFEASDYTVCANNEITLTDKSSLRPTKIKWLLESDAITNNSLDKSPIIIKYANDANHKVGIVASKFEQCFDTVFQFVKSIIVKSDFSAIETFMKCAPVYAQFHSVSKYADSLKWNFGDGNLVTTTNPYVANIYRKNSGPINGFYVSLIAKSNEGCSDTLLKSNYIHVLGPVPKFELSNNIGCEPLLVKFKNTSTDVFKHFINYDDGALLDSSFAIHTYKIITSGLDTQRFTPRMYALDSLGCKAEFVSPVQVIVLRNSKAAFDLSDSIICEKQTVNYNDKAVSIYSSRFYLNEKGNNQVFLDKNSVSFNKNGEYAITQIVINSNDCVDSLKKNIKVNTNPKADFILVDTLCLSKLIKFDDRSVSQNKIINYYWEIINPTTSLNYYTKNILHTFDAAGPASVILTVTDTNGCQNKNFKTFSIPNPTSIPTGELEVVSVNADSSIQVISKSTNFYRFLESNYYFSDSIKWIRSKNTKNKEQFDYWMQKAPDTASCFYFNTKDICGYESNYGPKHCTIFLKVIDAKPYTNRLNWTPYVGWPTVDQYSIYRKKTGDLNYSLLTIVDNLANTYLDSGLCNLTYFYYVEASFNTLRSRSNIEKHLPLFVFPPAFKDIRNVSVIDDNILEVKWEPTNSLNFNNYILYRTNVQTGKKDIFYTTKNNFVDKDVNTSENNYYYKVLEKDKCGYQSAGRHEGKNIVLKVNSENYKSFINWDSYKTWSSGIKEYEVQIEKDGQFKTIYKSQNTDSAFIHNQVLETIHGPYCYRIMAVSGNLQDSSYSNISCVISPSTLFFPNAFTPNGDDINEKISVRSLFVYNHTNLSGRNFTLEIFNRWGEKVYSSHSLDGEWDGIYMGRPVQSGVYSYRLKAMGVDDRSYSLNGTITIVP